MRNEKQKKFWRRMAEGPMGLKKKIKHKSSVATAESKHTGMYKQDHRM